MKELKTFVAMKGKGLYRPDGEPGYVGSKQSIFRAIEYEGTLDSKIQIVPVTLIFEEREEK